MKPSRVRELQVIYRPHPSGATMDARRLDNPRAVAALVVPILQDQPQEVFIIALLTTKHSLIAIHEVSKGGIDCTLVDPRVVFRAALLANATAIVLAHNHPSGDPTPSYDDLELTKRLVAAGNVLGIDVLDHIVVGDRQYVSFKETGRL